MPTETIAVAAIAVAPVGTFVVKLLAETVAEHVHRAARRCAALPGHLRQLTLLGRTGRRRGRRTRLEAHAGRGRGLLQRAAVMLVMPTQRVAVLVQLGGRQGSAALVVVVRCGRMGALVGRWQYVDARGNDLRVMIALVHHISH